MGAIWKEAFEVVGDGLPVAAAFYEKRAAQSEALWAAVKSFGADGYRQSYTGGIYSLFFPEVPDNYRKIGVGDDRLLECVPRKTSRAGRELSAAIAAVPPVTIENALLRDFGWNGNRPCDGHRIYHGTMTRVILPKVRYLACLPRELGDSFEPPVTLLAIPMSEYVRAFEEHNAAVATRKVAA